MKKIKYGIIGVGQMASGHLECIKKIEDIEIDAIADPSKEALEKFEKKLHNSKVNVFEDYKELLKLSDIDAVLVCTPDYLHVPIVLDCIAAEKHILCEKPAATTYEDLNKLESALRSYKKIYQTGLECRFYPIFKKTKELISNGSIGVPRILWCKEFRGPFLRKKENWILFQEKTGGVFVEKMCHYFDLLNWFSGSLPTKVMAIASQDVVKEIYGVKPDIYDNGWVLIEYKSGAKASAGLCMFTNKWHELEIGIIGDNGKSIETTWQQMIQKDREGCTTTKVEEVDTSYTEEISKLSHRGAVYYEHLEFLDCIKNNRLPLTNIEVAKWSVLVGLAAEESARKGGEPVKLE